MPNPYGIKRLPYPINRRTLLEQDDTSVFVSGNPIDTDDCSWFVVQLTNENRLKFTSALLAGLDLIYPDEFVSLFQLWLQPTDFPNQFPPSSEGCLTVDLCDLIIECINNPDSGVMQAITDNSSLQTAEQFRASAQNQAGLILGSGVNPTCDLDVLWGGIRSVIDLANDNNIDVLQIIEVVTNPYEFVQEVILGIFGVELPIIQSIVDWISWVQDNILENYEAEVTTAYLNDVMCDLFCLTSDGCQLTPETLTNYFYTRLGSGLTIGSLLDETIAFLIGGVWVGTQLADVFFLSQFAFRAQLGKWFRLIGFLSVDTDFRIGANTPDNDWFELCTDCPDILTYEWLGGDGSPLGNNWYIVGTASYNSGTDSIDDNWVSGATYQTQVRIDVPVGMVCTIESGYMAYSVKTGGLATQYILIYDEFNVIQQNNNDGLTSFNGTGNISMSGPITMSEGWSIRVISAMTTNTSSPRCNVTKMNFSLTGDNIFAP